MFLPAADATPFMIVAKGDSRVPSPLSSSPCSLDTNTPSSFVVQQLASSETSPVQAWVPLPPSPPVPVVPLMLLEPPVLAEPPVLTEPPLGPPASLPLPLPPVLPAVPALELLAAAPQVAVAVQSSAELPQAESCTLTRPIPKASVEKAVMRMLVAPKSQKVPDRLSFTDPIDAASGRVRSTSTEGSRP